MREVLLSTLSPEQLSWIGFLLLAIGLLGEVAAISPPLETHWTHKPIGFTCAVIVLAGYVIGHIGDDEIARRLEQRATSAENNLRALTADRSFSPEQSRSISSRLKSFAGQQYQLVTYGDMREPSTFSKRLDALLMASDWASFPTDRQYFLMAGTEGVQVWLHPKATNRTKEAAEALVDSLLQHGIAASLKIQASSGERSNVLNLSVGTKP